MELSASGTADGLEDRGANVVRISISWAPDTASCEMAGNTSNW